MNPQGNSPLPPVKNTMPEDHHTVISSQANQSNFMDMCAQFAKFMVKTVFNDSPELFLSWKATFQNIISEMDVSPVEEIDLLIKWLGPESSRQAKALRAAKAGDPNTCLQMIWERLNERFGSPEMIRAVIDKTLATFEKIKPGKDMNRLYDLADLVTEIGALKEDARYSVLLGYYDSPSGVTPIVNKLPNFLREKWTTEASRFKKRFDTLYPPFSHFITFIRDMAMVRNDPSFAYDNHTQDFQKGEGASTHTRGKMSRPAITVRKTETTETGSIEADSCPIHQTNHSLNHCRAFRNRPLGERKDLLFKKDLCFRSGAVEIPDI